MLYFLAIEIKGEPAEFYKIIGDELHNDFGLEPLYERLPFHITLKPPFFLSEKIEPLIDELGKCFSGHSPFSIRLSSVGRFGTKTIFLEPGPVDELHHLSEKLFFTVDRFVKKERTINRLSEGNVIYKNRHFHASLARFIKREDFNDVLKTIERGFSRDGWVVDVSSVSLFERSRRSWRTKAEFYLGDDLKG